MSIDKFLFRKFNEDTYNCMHFAAEVWADLTGEDLAKKLGRLLFDSTDRRRITRAIVRNFVRLARPVSPCLVIMQRARSSPHIAVYVRGRVLNIHQHGVQFQPIDVAARCFTSVTYFR